VNKKFKKQIDLKLGSIASEEISSRSSNLVFDPKDIKMQIDSFLENGGVRVSDITKEIEFKKSNNLCPGYETPTKIKKS